MTALPRAITLGEAHGGGGWLDLDDPTIKKFYLKGCQKLDGEPYDGKPKGLRLFIERLRGKAMMYGWTSDVLNVPIDRSRYFGQLWLCDIRRMYNIC